MTVTVTGFSTHVQICPMTDDSALSTLCHLFRLCVVFSVVLVVDGDIVTGVVVGTRETPDVTADLLNVEDLLVVVEALLVALVVIAARRSLRLAYIVTVVVVVSVSVLVLSRQD